MDHITILTHVTGRLTKLWQADGTISPYDETKNYKASQRQVADLRSLSDALRELEAQPSSAVIRGTPNGKDDSEAAPGRVRKIKASFDDTPHHWVLIEIDEYVPLFDPITDPEAAIDEFIRECLPADFNGISYHWQLSSSAGSVKRQGKLSAHVWFWLHEARTSEEVKAWSKTHTLPIDNSVLNAVQFHFTAAPLFAPTVADPVPRRSGFVEGLFGDTVATRIDKNDTAITLTDNVAWLMSLKPTLGWSVDDARTIIMQCDANTNRENWLYALMALHHELGDEGLDLADEWSSTATSYAGRPDVEGRWRSFGKGSGTITGKWLLKWRNECAVGLKYKAVDEWKDKIGKADTEFTLREKVCAEIAKDDRLGDLEREAVAQMLRAAFNGLGVKYPLAAVRKLVSPPKEKKSRDGEWTAGWVWVTEEDKFYKVDSEQWLTKTSFDACFNRLMARGEDGNIVANASSVALDDIGIKTFTRAIYLPWGSAEFLLHGVECVNKYRPSSVPTAVERLSARGRWAVGLVQKHIDLICGGRPEVIKELTQWLAHNVQKPGVKIRWAPLIKGVEGDGKSLISDLLAGVMGRPNVKSVSPKVLATDFTGWAQGSCVCSLEEIKMTGHNRHDVLNALKPYITNGSVEIHPKGKDSYEGVNTTNYIGFTNWSDALPLTDTDRRWFIIFTPWATKVDMPVDDPDRYFDELVEAIRTQPAELRRWLLEHPLDGFKPNANAPATAEKAEMIGMSVSDDEDTVLGVIERGAEGVGATVLSSRCLTKALAFHASEVRLETTTLTRLLTRLGWAKVAAQLKWKGGAHRIWVKGQQSRDPNELRYALEETSQKLLEGMPGLELEDLFADSGPDLRPS